MKLQEILTVLTLIMGALTAFLLNMGCTELSAGALVCSPNSVPVWLAPWTGIITTVLPIVKLILTKLQTGFGQTMAVVNNSGLPGTVTPAQVMSDTSGKK